jgi:hypothetical protein
VSNSVVFNLREIMQLEHERVAAERAAARAAEERVARGRVEAERRAAERERAVERERLQDAERAERERAAAVLRTQLEAQAAERAERRRIELDHARELERLRLERRGRRGTVLAFGMVAALLAGGAAAYLAVLQPRLQRARARETAATMLAANRARELAGLRERLTELDAQPAMPATRSRATDVTQPNAVGPTAPKPRLAGRSLARRPVHPPGTFVTLEPLDGENDDPLWGLEAHPDAEPARRHPRAQR